MSYFVYLEILRFWNISNCGCMPFCITLYSMRSLCHENCNQIAMELSRLWEIDIDAKQFKRVVLISNVCCVLSWIWSVKGKRLIPVCWHKAKRYWFRAGVISPALCYSASLARFNTWSGEWMCRSIWTTY